MKVDQTDEQIRQRLAEISPQIGVLEAADNVRGWWQALTDGTIVPSQEALIVAEGLLERKKTVTDFYDATLLYPLTSDLQAMLGFMDTPDSEGIFGSKAKGADASRGS